MVQVGEQEEVAFLLSRCERRYGRVTGGRAGASNLTVDSKVVCSKMEDSVTDVGRETLRSTLQLSEKGCERDGVDRVKCKVSLVWSACNIEGFISLYKWSSKLKG